MFNKKIEVISTKTKKIEEGERISFYIGKAVYSKTGELLGKVYDVILENDCVVGILIKSNKKIFIGKEFFNGNVKDVIVLKIEPFTSLIGKQIFDSTGKRIGRVVNVERKTTSNNYENLIVKKSIYRRSFKIPKKEIAIAKENIILKREYE
ncbi:hypothetical protein DRN73_04030 [Candidatus Pacearchaeota archaeon]|nr:MAG: hypothetical protein DRN73_04030 [Candidatus Pacearchaeota archaeon]